MFWGLSEALDLFEEYISNVDLKERQNGRGSDEKGIEINILLFGANDPRHVIKTLAKLYTHKNHDIKPTINFYMLDGCIEVVARNILLLATALESSEFINLHNKVHLFMDVYGNSLLRPSSHQYLVGKSKILLKLITDDTCREQLVPFLHIDDLKYKERDILENTFTFLLPKEGHTFSIQKYWSDRVRKLLGVRYDYRDGAFDWDLNMVLKNRKGQQICSQEYRYWRETGIAFTYPEYEYSKPNKTLAAGIIRNGDKFYHRGYIGDIQSGPFAAFGLESADKRLLKSFNGENDYRSTEITEYNLLELFHELTTGTSYLHDVNQSRKYGSVRLLFGKCLSHDEADMEEMLDYNKTWLKMDDINIYFLSVDEILLLQEGKERWRNFFDIVFVGHNYFTFLKEEFAQVLREKALLIMETKLMTTLRNEEVATFEEKLLNYAKTIGLLGVINYNVVNGKNSLLKFKRDIANT